MGTVHTVTRCRTAVRPELDGECQHQMINILEGNSFWLLSAPLAALLGAPDTQWRGFFFHLLLSKKKLKGSQSTLAGVEIEKENKV